MLHRVRSKQLDERGTKESGVGMAGTAPKIFISYNHDLPDTENVCSVSLSDCAKMELTLRLISTLKGSRRAAGRVGCSID